ncbi:PAS domain S-box protein [archaeon]|nr:PAS domain S-box protein [archaeon]
MKTGLDQILERHGIENPELFRDLKVWEESIAVPETLATIANSVSSFMWPKKGFKRLTSILDILPDGYYLASITAKFLYGNPAATKIIGIPLEDAVGKNFLTDGFLSEEDARFAKNNIGKLIKDGQIGPDEYTVITPNGPKTVEIVNLLLRIGWNWYILGAVRDISERIEQDATLLKSETLLREAQEVAGLGSYEFLITNNFWERTPVLDKIFGIDKNYVRTSEGWLNIVHPDDREMMREYLTQNILTNHEHFNKEYRILRPEDQQTRWVHGDGTLKDFVEEQPTRMIGTIRDVTERRLLEERMYQALSAVENNQNAISFTDMNNNITYVNLAFLEMYGYSSLDEMIGKNINIVRPQDIVDNDLSEVNSIHPKTVDGGEGWRGDLQNVTKDGRKIDIHLSTAPINDRDGNMIGAVGSAMDITAQNETNRALKESEEKYKSLFQNNIAAVFRSDLKTGKILDCNQALVDLFGYSSKDELVGFDAKNLYDSDSDRSEFVDAIKKGPFISQELILRKKDGTSISVLESSLLLDDGQTVQGTILDISDRAKAVEALLQAKKSAERADSYKTKYLSTLAHDVRTPLTIMTSYAAELKSKPDMPAKKRDMMLETITRRSEYLLALNNDILKSTSIGSGIIELRENNLNLQEISLDVVMGVKALVRNQEKPIDVKLNLPENLPTDVIGDYVKVVELFDNLGTNAVKFTDEGSIELGVRLKDDKTLDFYVKDTGCGIRQEDLDGIFEPFKQLDAGKQLGVSAGVGKGLSIVKGYAEQWGGEAYVTSELGKGSTFGFTLPLREGVLEAERIITAAEAIEMYDSNLRSKHIVLFVDDDPGMVRLVPRILNMAGYNAIGVESGEEAVKLFKKEQPSVVITDIGLHGKIDTGFMLADILRSVEQERGYEHTPVIGLGGDAKEDVFSNNPGNPLDNYLQKTQSHGLTIQMIDKYLLEQSDS